MPRPNTPGAELNVDKKSLPNDPNLSHQDQGPETPPPPLAPWTWYCDWSNESASSVDEDEPKSDPGKQSSNTSESPVLPAQPCSATVQSEQQPSAPSGRTLRDCSRIAPLQRYGFYHHYKPRSYEDAQRCKENLEWTEAMNDKLGLIEDLLVWEEYNGPEPKNTLKTTWIYKVKHNCHGDPVRYKAQLCVQGFNQIEGLDYTETFAPKGKPSTLRLMLLYALKAKQKIQQFDVKSAFLHSPIDKEVIIHTPKGSKRSSRFLRLRKSLYGLKQAPKNWYKTLTTWFKDVGFKESSCNLCLYLSDDRKSQIFFHVNDLILVGDGNNFEKEFLTCFAGSNAKDPDTILSMKIEVKDQEILLSQPNHIARGLKELALKTRGQANLP